MILVNSVQVDTSCIWEACMLTKICSIWSDTAFELYSIFRLGKWEHLHLSLQVLAIKTQLFKCSLFLFVWNKKIHKSLDPVIFSCWNISYVATELLSGMWLVIIIPHLWWLPPSSSKNFCPWYYFTVCSLYFIVRVDLWSPLTSCGATSVNSL